MAKLKNSRATCTVSLLFFTLIIQQVNCWSGFRVYRTEAELQEFEQLSPQERLERALVFPGAEIVEITGANQAATVQEGVSLYLDCSPWLQQFPGGSIQWYSLQLDEFGNIAYNPTPIQIDPTPPGSVNRITVGGLHNQWLNISQIELIGGAEDPDSKIFQCEVCVDRDTPSQVCHTANYTNRVIGAPPVIKETRSDTCLPGVNAAAPGDDGGTMATVSLGCTVLTEVPQPVPFPTLTWFRNGVPVAAFKVFGFSFDVNMNFLMQFPILSAGVFGLRGTSIPVFQTLSSGELIFSTVFDNITDPMLGNLAPDTTLRQARAMLLDILFANWTCVANNSLGNSAVEHHIEACVPQSHIPIPEVEGLCSVVVWDNCISQSPVSCEDILGYDVRLYHPESKHQNLTRRVEMDKTFHKISDEDKGADINHETHVQVRIAHKHTAGRWSEGTPIGCEKPTETPSGMYFELNNKIYLNNSALPLRDVGEGDRALLCKTDRKDCCGTPPNRYGEFYYPNGVAVPIASRQQSFYRNRGEQVIRLNRRSTATTPTGKYRCAIPGVDGEIQSIYVTLTEWFG